MLLSPVADKQQPTADTSAAAQQDTSIVSDVGRPGVPSTVSSAARRRSTITVDPLAVAGFGRAMREIIPPPETST